MMTEQIKGITREWKYLTGKVIKIEDIPVSDIEELLRDTYEVLYKYHKDTFIPKEVTEMLLEIEDFIGMSSTMEFTEKSEGYYHSFEVLLIIENMNNGFFKGEYSRKFPELMIDDINNKKHILNLNNNFLPLAL